MQLADSRAQDLTGSLGGAAGELGGFARALGGMRFPSIPSYASGTSWHPGGMAWVGEQGPELVAMPRGSQVYSSGQSRQMVSGGDGASGDAELKSIMVAVAENTRKTRKLLEEIKYGGIPAQAA
jgi:hypothetical protein